MGVFLTQIVGYILGIVGVILTIIVTSMVQWRVSYMVEGNPVNCEKRIDGQWLSRWDGLWQTCISRNSYKMTQNVLQGRYDGTQGYSSSSNNMQCSEYESLIIISDDLKASRVLMSFAIIVSMLALIFAAVGLFCFRWFRSCRDNRYCLILTAGILFLLGFVLVAISIIWSTAAIVEEILHPRCRTTQRLEVGEAIYLGWINMFFLLAAGIIFCWFRPCQEEMEEEKCKTTVYSSQVSLQRPVYVPCETQEQDRCSTQYSRSQYI